MGEVWPAMTSGKEGVMPRVALWLQGNSGMWKGDKGVKDVGAS